MDVDKEIEVVGGETYTISVVDADKKKGQGDYHRSLWFEREVARIAHEVNRAYCAAIGDSSQPKWDDAPEWQKQSAMAGVKAHIDNPYLTPEQSHEKWLEHKKAEGWTWGEVKDEQKKEHPCFRPYKELPTEQQVKDYLFRAVVHAMVD